MSSKKVQIKIRGMHCASCEVLIKDAFEEIKGVKKAEVKIGEATIETNGEVSLDKIEQVIKQSGYEIGEDHQTWITKKKDDWICLLFGVGVVLLVYWAFLRWGNLAIQNNGVFSYSLVMGLAAGFSTCMALVGGLVLSISAKITQQQPQNTIWQKTKPQFFFNLGRILGFVVLGSLLGLFGSFFVFSPFLTALLTILAGLFMLALGLQLSGIFPRFTAWTVPKTWLEKLGWKEKRNAEYSNHGAIVLGVLTFFLPCGFTQAMQLLALAAGSWWMGGIMMGLFALGTTPGLLLVGTVSAFLKGKWGQRIFKIIGVLVVAMSVYTIGNACNLVSFKSTSTVRSETITELDQTGLGSKEELSNEIQKISLKFYDVNRQFALKEIKLEQGKNYQLEILPEKDGAGCMSTIMLPKLSNDRPKLIRANQPISFYITASEKGEYRFVCAMGVTFNLKIIVE